MNTSISYKQLIFVCHYKDDITEIAKDLTFRNYASIMHDAAIHTLESILYLPITYERAIINDLTPWIKAGITYFNICHVFSVELSENCVNETTLNNTYYLALARFEIAAMYNIEKFQNKLIEMFTSVLFKEKFSVEMNLRLSNYISTYHGFTSIDIEIIDAEKNNIMFSTTTTMDLKMSVTHPDIMRVTTDVSLASISRNWLIVTGVILTISCIISICGCIICYRKHKDLRVDTFKDGIQRSIQLQGQRYNGEEIEINQHRDDILFEQREREEFKHDHDYTRSDDEETQATSNHQVLNVPRNGSLEPDFPEHRITIHRRNVANNFVNSFRE